MYLIFRSDGRLKASATVKYSSNSDSEVVKQISESELDKIIPDSFEETDWKQVRRHYKLEDGEVVFDEDYEPETEDEE